MEFRYYNILVIDTLASDPIAISDIYFQVTGECTDMCNINAYCDTEGATPTCVCRDGWLGDGIYCYHTNTICDLDFGQGIVCGGDAIHGGCYADEYGIENKRTVRCLCFPGWLAPLCSEMDPSVTTTPTTSLPTTTTQETAALITTEAVTTAAMTTADQAYLPIPTTTMPPLTCLMERSSMSYTRIQDPSVITYAVEVVNTVVLSNLPNKIHKCASHCSADPDCVMIGFDIPTNTCYIFHVAVSVIHYFSVGQEYLCEVI
ncbi:PREDICTED: uncharacterized protein LOC106815944 isoform X2 [Priapulus caudatus]|uniref:Uncharacterized protein LOC106815944 isoform X2 n=1 Tax=Priapulus caudatus TaxID=37621 RepID=A0ABM1EUU6_PRICU|nr:PREDICTED: uncharacterized protein LOC106815944 isoform X2 [Priapulus caudatus]